MQITLRKAETNASSLEKKSGQHKDRNHNIAMRPEKCSQKLFYLCRFPTNQYHAASGPVIPDRLVAEEVVYHLRHRGRGAS